MSITRYVLGTLKNHITSSVKCIAGSLFVFHNDCFRIRRWIDAGNPVNAQDNTQKTPLHHAAQWGQEETLDLLVSCGADVNATDFIEDTPLHFVRAWLSPLDEVLLLRILG